MIANEVAQVGGESHGSIAWSAFGHYQVPMLNWVLLAILLFTLVAVLAAVAGLIAPRRMRNTALILGRALAKLGPLLGLLGAAMTLHQMAVHQIDGDPRAFDSTQAIATGVAAMSLMTGLSAGIVGVITGTLLKLIGNRDADPR